MAVVFEFEITDVQPIPKARPRFAGGRIHTAPKTAQWETRVGWAARLAGAVEMDGDLSVTIRFYRKGKGRADLDNLVKAVLDGLNGIAFSDDKQVVRLNATVEYGCKQPGIYVRIEDA